MREYLLAAIALVAVTSIGRGEDHDALLGQIERQEYSWQSIVNIPDRDLSGHVPMVLAVDSTEWPPEQRTLLTSAIRAQDWTLACYLVGKGADVNECTNYGFSPMWLLAAQSPSRQATQVAEMLLAKGADPDISPRRIVFLTDAETPLHLAANWQNVALLNLLLDYGADARIETPDGRTASDRLRSQIDLRRQVIGFAAESRGTPLALSAEKLVKSFAGKTTIRELENALRRLKQAAER